MTSLRKRLDNVLVELAIIRHGLDDSSRCPPCCLTVRNDGKISCDVVGPLPKKEFLKECENCKAKIKRMLSRVNFDDVDKCAS